MKTKGLTLKEAIESGKPFRRAGEGEWYLPNKLQYWFITKDIFMNDWEIKVEPREWDAWVSGTHISDSNMSEYVGWKKIRVREVLDHE